MTPAVSQLLIKVQMVLLAVARGSASEISHVEITPITTVNIYRLDFSTNT